MKDICELCSLCSPQMGCTKLENESCLKEAIKLIKPSVTNGEVIQTMFPDVTISFEEEWDSYDNGDICHPYVERFVNVDFGYEQIITFNLEWWNRKWGE